MWYLAEVRFLEASLIVSREAEVDEPLLVEAPGHLLQDRDAPRVVLDQIVIRRQDRRNAPLEMGIGSKYGKLV